MKAPPSQISSWCRSTYQCLISSQMALNRDYKFCFAVTPISARSAQCLIFKATVARPLFVFCAQLCSLSLLSLLPYLPVMLMDTTESTSELGWTTYPDTGVSRKLGGTAHSTCLKGRDARVCNGFNVGSSSTRNPAESVTMAKMAN